MSEFRRIVRDDESEDRHVHERPQQQHPLQTLQALVGNRAVGSVVPAAAADKQERSASALGWASGIDASKAAVPVVQRDDEFERRRKAVEEEFVKVNNRISGVGGVFAKQKDAVRLLNEYLKDSPEPGLSWSLLSAAAATALGAATGGISGIVVAAIARRVVTGIGSATQELLKETVKQQLTTLVGKGVNEAKAAYSSEEPSRLRFLEIQKTALDAAAIATGDALAERRDYFMTAEDGLEQLVALRQGYDEVMEVAFDHQFVASLAEWSRLVDRADPFELIQDEREPGVLGLRIRAGAPADDLEVTSAHLEGLPEKALERLAQTRGMTVGHLIGTVPGLSGGGLALRVIGDVSWSQGSGEMVLESMPGQRANPSYPRSGHGWYFLFQRGRHRYGMRSEGTLDQPDPSAHSQAMVTANLLVNREIGSILLSDLGKIEG